MPAILILSYSIPHRFSSRKHSSISLTLIESMYSITNNMVVSSPVSIIGSTHIVDREGFLRKASIFIIEPPTKLSAINNIPLTKKRK